MRIAGDHAHVVAAEHVDQVEELFGDQRLDRRGVVGAPAGAQRSEVHGERHQRLAGARRGVEDHMVAGEQVHDGLLLVRPRLDALDVLDPTEEALVDLVGVDVAPAAVPVGRQRPQRPVGPFRRVPGRLHVHSLFLHLSLHPSLSVCHILESIHRLLPANSSLLTKPTTARQNHHCQTKPPLPDKTTTRQPHHPTTPPPDKHRTFPF